MIYLYVVVCNIFFLPIILCNDTVTKSKVINNTPPVSVLPNVTQVPIEGDSISSNELAMALPKNNDIPSLEKETGKNKIVPRKGAGNYTDDITDSSEKSILSLSGNIPLKANTSIANFNATKEQSTTTIKNITLQIANSTAMNNSFVSANTTVQLPKKPLILNADLLENAQPEVKSSPETVHSQIQSPNSKVKTYISSANNHPGMVMPIVITILLVPMFAVLGYMALRRGQEAWKNRHYKRMDFLLDGMYND